MRLVHLIIEPWEYYGDQERLRTAKYCYEQAVKAEGLKHNSSPVEVALIDALCVKHPVNHAQDIPDMKEGVKNYADAMRGVYLNHCDDLVVICLIAEALMGLSQHNILIQFRSARIFLITLFAVALRTSSTKWVY